MSPLHFVAACSFGKLVIRIKHILVRVLAQALGAELFCCVPLSKSTRDNMQPVFIINFVDSTSCNATPLAQPVCC